MTLKEFMETDVFAMADVFELYVNGSEEDYVPEKHDNLIVIGSGVSNGWLDIDLVRP